MQHKITKKIRCLSSAQDFRAIGQPNFPRTVLVDKEFNFSLLFQGRFDYSYQIGTRGIALDRQRFPFYLFSATFCVNK
ncbi:MAG: hypothetical protein H7325_00570 [Pedobacter sp.]|nr:hypothetical protein [Pedobacter sp.]